MGSLCFSYCTADVDDFFFLNIKNAVGHLSVFLLCGTLMNRNRPEVPYDGECISNAFVCQNIMH